MCKAHITNKQRRSYPYVLWRFQSFPTWQDSWHILEVIAVDGLQLGLNVRWLNRHRRMMITPSPDGVEPCGWLEHNSTIQLGYETSIYTNILCVCVSPVILRVHHLRCINLLRGVFTSDRPSWWSFDKSSWMSWSKCACVALRLVFRDLWWAEKGSSERVLKKQKNIREFYTSPPGIGKGRGFF